MRFNLPQFSIPSQQALMPLINARVAALVLAGLLPAATANSAPFAYVALEAGNRVAVVDLATTLVASEIAVGNKPHGIAASPDGRSVYVANSFSFNVSVIDTLSNQVTATISPQSSAGNPFGLAVHPNGSRLYVANVGGSLGVVDLATRLTVAQVPLASPQSVAVNRSGTFAYVSQASQTGPGNLAVVDLASNQLVGTVPVTFNRNIEFSPDDTRAFVATFDGVAVVDTAARTRTATWTDANLARPYNVEGIALSADGRNLYAVTRNFDKTLSIFDTRTGEVTNRLTLRDAPSGVAVDSALQLAIVTSVTEGTITFVDLRTNQAVKTMAIGSQPQLFGNVIAKAAQPEVQTNTGGGGGCGIVAGPGGPLDPTLPILAVVALIAIGLRGSRPQRSAGPTAAS